MSTEPTDLVTTLTAAYEAAGRELDDLMTESGMLSRRLDELAERAIRAQQTQNALRELLEQHGAPPPGDVGTSLRPIPRGVAMDQLARRFIDPSELAQQIYDHMHSKRPVGLQDVAVAAGVNETVLHALEVLQAASGPLRPTDVLREFEEREWVPSNWKHPAQSIYGALKRAEQLGVVERTDDSRWQLGSRGMTLYAQAQKTSHEISLRRAAREKVMSERELATEHEMAAITKARIAKLSSSRSRDDSDDTEVASRRDPQKMSTADRTSGA